MKGGENTLNLSALKAAALQARATKAWPKPPSYPKGTPKPASVVVNAPNYSLGNSTTRFLKTRTEEVYEKARQAIVIKDLLLILSAEKRCKGSVVLRLPDVEGLKEPVLRTIQMKYGQSGGALFGPSKKEAVQKVLDSVLSGTPVDCALIPLAMKKLQDDYQVTLPGERELPDYVNGFNVSLRNLEFLQSGNLAYNKYKNISPNIVSSMLIAEKGEGSTLEGHMKALKLLPELGLTRDQLEDQFKKEATYRDNLFTYTLFLKAIKDLNAKGVPIQKEYVVSLAKEVRRDTLPDILTRILKYARSARWIRNGNTNPNLPRWLEEARPQILAKIRSDQEQGISADPVLLGSAFALLTSG